MPSVKCAFVTAALAACGGGTSGPKNDGPPPTAYPLNGIASFEYTLNITVGGAQTFDVVLDTGSTTLGIASTACTTCDVTPEYTPGATATDEMKSVTAEYEDGTGWSGEIYSDSVAVTGDMAVPVKLVAISSQSSFFSKEPREGILGFGRIQIALPDTDSYVDNRMAAGLSQVFALQLCPENGTLWFGGADKTHETADEQYTALAPITDDQPFYVIDISSTSINGMSLALSGPAVVDTGTSLLTLPTDLANTMATAIMTSDGYRSIFGSPLTPDPNSCISTSHTVDDINAALPPLEITLMGVDGKPFTLSLPATNSYLRQFGGAYCAAFVGSPDVGSGSMQIPPILGDGFLRALITVFDLENMQIGFAPQQNCVFPTDAHVHDPDIAPLFRGHPMY